MWYGVLVASAVARHARREGGVAMALSVIERLKAVDRGYLPRPSDATGTGSVSTAHAAATCQWRLEEAKLAWLQGRKEHAVRMTQVWSAHQSG